MSIHPDYGPDSFDCEDRDNFYGLPKMSEPENSIGENKLEEVSSIEITVMSEGTETGEMETGFLKSPDDWY